MSKNLHDADNDDAKALAIPRVSPKKNFWNSKVCMLMSGFYHW